jgi:hypothetical protein
MAKVMSGAGGLCSHVTGIIGIDRRFDRHASSDLNPRFSRAVELGRIVGQQHNASDPEHFQHAGSDSKLMESGVEFVAADFPQANRLTIQPQANVFADQSSGGMRLGGVENLTFASPPLLGLSVAIASRFTGLPIPAPPAQPQQRPDATLVALELIKESIRQLLGRLKK